MKLLLLLTFLLTPALSFADGTDEIGREAEGLQRNMDQVRRVLQERLGNLPAVDQAQVEAVRRKVMALAGDQKFLKAAGDLWQSSERNTLLIAELVFGIFMYFFKAWRLAKASNWFTRTLSGLFLSLFSWLVMLLVLPSLILGEPFRVVVSSLWRAFTS